MINLERGASPGPTYRLLTGLHDPIRGWWRSRYRELRDDRCEWHFRRLWRTYNDEHPLKLRYLTKATTPGTYYAPGTMVERIYQPEIRGRAAGRELVVEPKR